VKWTKALAVVQPQTVFGFQLFYWVCFKVPPKHKVYPKNLPLLKI